jgi:hypothetical protein
VCKQSGRGAIEVSGIRVVPALSLIAEPMSMRGRQEGVSYNELPHIISGTPPEVASALRGSRRHSQRWCTAGAQGAVPRGVRGE